MEVKDYVEGFKIPEIAELLDMNANTVKTRLARAREQIRSAYTGGVSKVARSSKENVSSIQGGISDEKTEQFSRFRKYTVG